MAGGLKGHGNEADFLGFLQKLVWHRLLTLNFEPFRFGLRVQLYSLADTPQLPPFPSHLGSYTRALLVARLKGHGNEADF